MGTLTSLILLCATTPAAGAETVPFDSPRWKLAAAESRVEEHLGRPSLLLRGGLAVIEDAAFLDGVIEFDVALPEARGFAGAVWRVQDPHDYEQFYMRPHQSGNPDANQYTPVFNGLPGWQLYHGPGYGAPVRYRFGEWTPVRIVVSGGEAEVYVGDMQRPAVYVDDLKRAPAAGGVGLSVADFAPAHFSGFRFTRIERPVLRGRVDRARKAEPGTIPAWVVSPPFAEATVAGRTSLDAAAYAGLEWTRLEGESTGLANLARLSGIGPGRDTVFARVTVRAPESTTRLLRFGYSDRVRVFLNRRLLYAGDNGYRSRDYRYLGTIGLFDAVALPLAEGDNELLFAVSESFGGWGLLAAIDDPAGLEVQAE